MASSHRPRGKTEPLHTALSKWATEEMKYHATSQNSQSNFHLPSEDDFKFLCSGPLVDVWKYVSKHVKSVQNSKFIKGNAELKRSLVASNVNVSASGNEAGDSEEEREKAQLLNQQRSSLSRELQQTRAEVAQLHKELGHAADELAGTELAYQSVCQRVRNLQCKENLLHVTKSCAEEAVARYTEYTDRVEKCFTDITDKKEDDKENFISGSNQLEDEELETESCHMVRQACEDISRFLSQSLSTTVDKSQLESCKSDLLDKVDRAAAVNSTRSLVSALSNNVELDAKRLRKKLSAVDITKDAAEISFTYDPKEGLHDVSSPLSTSDTVRQLLLANYQQHVLRWFKEQEHKNEEWKLSSRQTEITGELNKLLTRVIGDHPSHLAVAKGYVTARMRLAEERAVAPCLRKEASRLMDRIEECRKERQELQVKHSQIQNFQKLVGKKQAVISRLARLNASAPDRLKTHKQQVEAYLESRSLSSHLSEVQMLPLRLKGALMSEMDCFLGLLMPCLLTVHIDSHTRMCALDLSISPALYAVAYDRLQTYTDIGKALEFPSHKSVECLPLHVLKLHTSMDQLRSAHKQREVTVTTLKAMSGTTDDISTFLGLCKTAEEQDSVQCEKLLPLLKESSQLTKKHRLELENLKKAVNTWWEQPAQWTTPWVRSGGLTFDQWMQRWRMAMTQAHSKFMVKRGGLT